MYGIIAHDVYSNDEVESTHTVFLCSADTAAPTLQHDVSVSTMKLISPPPPSPPGYRGTPSIIIRLL